MYKALDHPGTGLHLFDLFPYSKIVSFSLSFSSISITNYPLDSDVYETKDKVWASCSVNGLPSPYSTTWPTVERNYPASSIQLSSKTESHKAVLDKAQLTIMVTTKFRNRMSNGSYRDEASSKYFTVGSNLTIHMKAQFV